MSSKDDDLESVLKLVSEVKANSNDIQKEWDRYHENTSKSSPCVQLDPGDVIVSKSKLDQIFSECEQLQNLLVYLSPRELTGSVSKLPVVENELENIRSECSRLQSERDRLKSEVNHWKTQLNEAVTQAQKDKQSSLDLQMDIQQLTSQLCEQSEFCSSLGSTLATVIWKLSRQEDCVSAMMAGSKLGDLLSLISNCIHSFQTAYQGDQWPDGKSDEASFILALTGIFTNMAASAIGREHLSTNPKGLAVIDTFIKFLQENQSDNTDVMKNLMLTGLYNLSINQKGVKYLCSCPNLIPRLSSILRCSTSSEQHQVNTLRLLQSLTTEESGPHTNMMLQLKESLPLSCLEGLARSHCSDLRELALDILSDLRSMEQEP